MTCADFLEIADALVLGALDPGEQHAAEAHLQEPAAHQGCPAALRRAERAVEALVMSLQPIQPPPHVWAGIERELFPARRKPLPVPPRRSRTLLGAAAIAASLVFAGALGVWLAGQQRQNRSLSEGDEALVLLHSPTSRLVPLAPQGESAAHAQVVLDVAGQRALLVASALPVRAGRDYQLWLIRGEAKISAGLLRVGAGGEAVARIDQQLLGGSAPDALAVSIEPQGGSPQPTGPIILLGLVPKA